MPNDEQTLLNGPDQVVPAEEFITWKPNGAVKLRRKLINNKNDEYGVEYWETISIPTLIKRTAEKYPDQMALRFVENGIEKSVNYSEYENKIRAVAKAFLKLGLEKHHAVCILGYNSEKWMYSALAAILAGGFQAGIYPTNSEEACLHCILLSSANIIVVEDDLQLQKILSIKNRAPNLKAIIQYTGNPHQHGVYSWKRILEIGENETDLNLEHVIRTIAVNECCSIVYTSGTTGLPKAVMLSHYNMINGAKNASSFLKMEQARERILSYLPLSHIASQILDLFVPWTTAATVYIADKNVLKNTLTENLIAARPTIFVAVPRVWEKLKENLIHYENTCSSFHRWIISLAKNSSLTYYQNLSKGFNYEPLLYRLLRYVIYQHVKSKIGLEYCHMYITGGAPGLQDTKEYFYSLDVPMVDVYGLSETTGIISLSKTNLFDSGIGECIDNMEMKILHPDENDYGEICVDGCSVFMGYLNDEEKTKEVFDSEMWFRTGDIGFYDCNISTYFLTGRLKELVITAGGENIPAPLIEFTVKSEIPVISNAVLIGDKRKYLVILLTLKSEMEPETGAPTDYLAEETKQWCLSLGCNYTKISDIIENKPEQIYFAIEDGIKHANEKAISNAQKIQKFAILPVDFSPATEEIGPTMKLKRSLIYKKYEHIINELYMDK